jgi:hypothetical protein
MKNQTNCQHDWRNSFSIGSLGTLVQTYECEQCGYRKNNLRTEGYPPKHLRTDNSVLISSSSDYPIKN